MSTSPPPPGSGTIVKGGQKYCKRQMSERTRVSVFWPQQRSCILNSEKQCLAARDLDETKSLYTMSEEEPTGSSWQIVVSGKEGCFLLGFGLVYELHSKTLVYTMSLWAAQLDSIDHFLKKKRETWNWEGVEKRRFNLGRDGGRYNQNALYEISKDLIKYKNGYKIKVYVHIYAYICRCIYMQLYPYFKMVSMLVLSGEIRILD